MLRYTFESLLSTPPASESLGAGSSDAPPATENFIIPVTGMAGCTSL